MSRNGLITKFHSHEKDASFASKEEQSKQDFIPQLKKKSMQEEPVPFNFTGGTR